MSSNPTVNPTIYQPRNFTVTNVQASNSRTLVTTQLVHDYVIGQQVRFHIPFPYGMQQINNQDSFVTTLNSTTSFTADIDSSKFDSFIVSPSHAGNTVPQVSAIGDRNNTITGLSITGSFQQT